MCSYTAFCLACFQQIKVKCSKPKVWLFNVTRTLHLSFDNVTRTLHLSFDNVALRQVSTGKYLEVHIDQYLTWN